MEAPTINQIQKIMDEDKKKQQRRLLHVSVTYKRESIDDAKCQENICKQILSVVREMKCLEKFRKQPEKNYFVINSCGCYPHESQPVFAFIVRLKHLEDSDSVVSTIKELNNVVSVESSWFPSNADYGGVYVKGKLYETWDI